MVIDREGIDERLEKIREELDILKKYLPLPIGSYLSDDEKIHASYHCLQVAIQCCLDIANLIIAGEDLGRPKDNVEIFRILSQYDIIPVDVIETYTNLVRFRNILVHVYLKVDPQEVFETLSAKIEDIERFCAFISKYLEGKPE